MCNGFDGSRNVSDDSKERSRNGQENKKTWLLYALLSAVFASLTSILAKVGMQDVDSNLGTAIRTAVVLVMAWVVVFATGKQKTIHGIGKKMGYFLCCPVWQPERRGSVISVRCKQDRQVSLCRLIN